MGNCSAKDSECDILTPPLKTFTEEEIQSLKKSWMILSVKVRFKFSIIKN